jgi:hypothetical protein
MTMVTRSSRQMRGTSLKQLHADLVAFDYEDSYNWVAAFPRRAQNS